jgi:hypothetical protein
MLLRKLLKKSNYTSWAIDPADFPAQASIKEKMLFLLGFTVLAPSGHNTQPWMFNISENRIVFSFIPERSLHDSDPEGRQLLIAFGCALENFSIAAKHFGFEPKITLFPFPNKDNRICLIECINATPMPQNLLFAISKRHTNRGPYDNAEVAVKLVEDFRKLSSKLLEVIFINNPGHKEKLAEIAIRSQIASMEKKSFRNELSGFIKSSYTQSFTGMPGFVLGIPSFVSLFASSLIKRMNLSRLSEKKDRHIIKQTPGFIIITSKEDEPTLWIESGRIFERAWLTATSYGVSFSPLTAVVQEKEYRKEFENSVGTNFHVVAFARVGIPLNPSLPSPRFPVNYLISKK